MTAVESDRLTVDLLDPQLYQRNPHDVWAWMRANEPVYRDDRNGLWGITRHAGERARTQIQQPPPGGLQALNP